MASCSHPNTSTTIVAEDKTMVRKAQDCTDCGARVNQWTETK